MCQIVKYLILVKYCTEIDYDCVNIDMDVCYVNALFVIDMKYPTVCLKIYEHLEYISNINIYVLFINRFQNFIYTETSQFVCMY